MNNPLCEPVATLQCECLAQPGFPKQSVRALQASLDRFGFSLPGGRFDINRECEKIEIKKQLLALIITALFVDNQIRPFLPTAMLNQSIGPNMRFSLLRNASFGIALTLVFSLEAAQAQLTGLGGTTGGATGLGGATTGAAAANKLPGSFGGLGVTGQSRIELTTLNP